MYMSTKGGLPCILTVPGRKETVGKWMTNMVFPGRLYKTKSSYLSLDPYASFPRFHIASVSFLFASFVPSQASFSVPSFRGWTPSILPLLAAAPKAAVVGPNPPPLPSGQMRKTPSPFSVVLSESLVSDRRTDVQRRNWGRKRSGGERGRGERGRGGVLRLEGTDGLKKRGEGGGQGPDGLEMKRRDGGRAPFQVCPFSAHVSFWPEGGGHSESPKARR